MSKQPLPAPTASAIGPCPTVIQTEGRPGTGSKPRTIASPNHPIPEGIWLVGCFGFNGPLRQYFSLYQAVSQREGERGEKRIDESKNVQTTPTRTYYKCSKPLSYCYPNCRTPRHWKFTQHHRTTHPGGDNHCQFSDTPNAWLVVLGLTTL